MEVFHTIAQAAAGAPAAVACGYFDGLHIGHAAVVGRAVQRAKEEGLCAGVFTFTRAGGSPERKAGAGEIVTEADKYAILDAWGVQRVLAPDFSEFHNLEPEEFFDEVLVRRMGARVVCCGADFRFGRAAAGGAALLEKLCASRGVALEIVPEVLCGGVRVSSTRIREMLAAGDVKEAGRLLGRAFGYRLTVVHGKRLGRTIDSPTINQRFPKSFVRLRHGVYAAAAVVDGALLPAVANIGLRPTVEQTDAVNSETYIIGFSGDLYGRQIEVRLLEFLRDEQKFASVDALRARIQADARASVPIAKAYTEKTGK